MRSKWKCIVGGLMVLPVVAIVTLIIYGIVLSIIKDWLVIVAMLIGLVLAVILALLTDKGLELIRDCVKEGRRNKKEVEK